MPIEIRATMDTGACQNFYQSTLIDMVENGKNIAAKVQQKANEIFIMVRDKIIETPLSPVVAKLYSIFTQVEIALNVAACLPILGTAFSWLRMTAGKIQLLIGAAILVFGKAGHVISQYGRADEKTLNKWKIISSYGAENVLHGCLNVLRGLGEILIGAATLGFGTVALLIPNIALPKEPFGPVIKYGDFLRIDFSDNGEENAAKEAVKEVIVVKDTAPATPSPQPQPTAPAANPAQNNDEPVLPMVNIVINPN